MTSLVGATMRLSIFVTDIVTWQACWLRHSCVGTDSVSLDRDGKGFVSAKEKPSYLEIVEGILLIKTPDRVDELTELVHHGLLEWFFLESMVAAETTILANFYHFLDLTEDVSR